MSTKLNEKSEYWWLVEAALKKDVGKGALLDSFEIVDEDLNKFTKTSSIKCVQVVYQEFPNGKLESKFYEMKIANPKLDSSSKQVQETLQKREILILTSFGDEMNKELKCINLPSIRTIKLFSHSYSTEEGQTPVFVSECVNKQGFRKFTHAKPMDLKHSKLVVEELGKIHASSILMEKNRKQVPDCIKYFKESNDQIKLNNAKHESLLNHAMDLLENKLPEFEKVNKWKKTMDKFTDTFLERNLEPTSKFNVLIHGGTYAENLYFKYNNKGNPVDVRFTNFENGKNSSPAADLVFFFFSSFTDHFRKCHKNQLLSWYYLAFSHVLSMANEKIPFTLEELKEEYRNRHPLGNMIGLLLLPTILAKHSNNNLNEESEGSAAQDDIENISTMSNEKRQKYLQAALSNPFLNERLIYMVQEMIKVGIYDNIRTIYNPYKGVTEEFVEEALRKDLGKENCLVAFDIKFKEQDKNVFSTAKILCQVYYKKDDDNDIKNTSYEIKINPEEFYGTTNIVLEFLQHWEHRIVANSVEYMNMELVKIMEPHLKVPKVLAYNFTEKEQVMLLEDLEQDKFVKMSNQLKEMDIEHSLLVMEELGRFHASSILHSNDSVLIENIFESNGNEMKELSWFVSQQIDNALCRLDESFKSEKFVETLKKIQNNVEEFLKTSTNKTDIKFDVLIHGYLNNTNILFRYNDIAKPVDVRFTDFKLSQRASPGCDLIQFLCCNLATVSRKEFTRLLLVQYYQSFAKVLYLAEQLVPFTFQELEIETKNRMLYGLISTLVGLPKDDVQNDNTKYSPNKLKETKDSRSWKESSCQSLLEEMIQNELIQL